MDLKFPKGFLWGTSTSSYQVEGNIRNDWSVWEKSTKRRVELEKEGSNPDEFISGRACDHYNLYEKDFSMAKALHNNAHRFSVEWARIEPEQGKFDEKEILHYKKVIKALRKRKLEPFLTANHFTLPVWISEEGGWLNRKTLDYFRNYISRISEEFSDVKFWMTINEPVVIPYKAYWQGRWPPCIKDGFKATRVMNNLIDAHKLSYKVIHEKWGREVGIAQSIIYFLGLLFFSNYFYNWYFLDNIRSYQDFIGLNYYTRKRIPREKNIERSDMGWAVYPKGIYAILKKLSRYNVPIYITENGIADKADTKRERYIIHHLHQVYNAIQSGIDVRGYFYWSLLDNFEWDSGFTQRFGLAEMDYKTMKRKPRKSFSTYAKICKDNCINEDLQKKFF